MNRSLYKSIGIIALIFGTIIFLYRTISAVVFQEAINMNFLSWGWGMVTFIAGPFFPIISLYILIGKNEISRFYYYIFFILNIMIILSPLLTIIALKAALG